MPGESNSTPAKFGITWAASSGPLLDRIDLHIEVPPVKFQEISAERTGETSAQIRERVITARGRQHERFKGRPRVGCNARMGSRELKQYCALDETALRLIQFAMSDLNLSARLRPHPEGVAHHRRSGRSRRDYVRACFGGDPIPLPRPPDLRLTPAMGKLDSKAENHVQNAR